MKTVAKKLLREYCPNIPALRRKFNDAKLREINKYIMDETDISAGEASPEQCKAVVKAYSEKWPKYTARLNEKLEEYIARCEAVRNREDLSDLREKVLFACFAYGFLPDEFFAYELEHKSRELRESYISNRDLECIVYRVNDIIDLGVFFDKYKTYQKFKRYFLRDAVSVEKSADYAAFSAFVEKHPVFVKKNVALSKGDSVELVDINQCGKSPKELFDEMAASGKHIVEEKVCQSDVMNGLNPSSVNTIRCMTFSTKNGIEIGPCFLKVGQGGSFVDNGGKGGILIGIDNQTGVLDTVGYDEFLCAYETHPDTNAKFCGYQLPQWDDMRRMAKEMSAKMPGVKYIGWDLAHTDQGWVVIEGNGSGQFIGPQIVWKKGFKKEIERIINA